MGGLASYFIRRLLLIIPTFLGMTIIFFFILQIVPGGPLEMEMMKLRAGMATMGGGEMSAGGGNQMGQIEIPKEAMDQMKKYYGMDKPIIVRYANWLWNVLHLDLGRSYVYAEPVWDVIKSRFPVSIYFGLVGFILSYSVCIPLGIAKAIKHGSKFDIGSSILVFIGYSTPGWALGLVLLVLLGGGSFWSVFPLGDFRSENWDQLTLWAKIVDQGYHSILPTLCYVISDFALLTVLMKNSLLENLSQDYVRTAFAKGLPEKRVIFVHTLRNSLIPLATGIGHVISIFLAGSFLIERTFNINGIGLLGYQSIIQRDYPVSLGFLVIGGVLGLLGNILSAVAYAIVDPRIRFK